MHHKLVVMMMTLLFSLNTTAGIETELNSFFHDLASTNITNPQVYDGQRAGLYTGGSLYARMPVKNVHIMNITKPSATAGCGGIDLYAGSFSFIKKDEFVETAKNIMNNAKGYAFKIALSSMTPMLEKTLNDMQDVMGDINRMNINSCETASALVDGVFNKSAEARKHACRDLGTQHGIFTDWAASRHNCNSEDGVNKVLKNKKLSTEDLERLGTDINLAWYSMNKDKKLQLNEEDTLKEMLMNLTGTIVVQYQNKDKPAFTLLPSQVNNTAFLHALLNGGTTQYYRCTNNDKQCLSPQLSKYTVKHEDSISYYVNKMLSSLVAKSLNEVSLTDEELGFLNATSLPIYKMINVNAAFANKSPMTDVSAYAQTIAYDILTHFIESNLNYVQQMSRHLQVDGELLKEFESGVMNARKSLRTEYQKVLERFYERNSLIEKTRHIEQVLSSQLSSQLAQNVQWAQKMRSAS